MVQGADFLTFYGEFYYFIENRNKSVESGQLNTFNLIELNVK